MNKFFFLRKKHIRKIIDDVFKNICLFKWSFRLIFECLEASFFDLCLLKKKCFDFIKKRLAICKSFFYNPTTCLNPSQISTKKFLNPSQNPSENKLFKSSIPFPSFANKKYKVKRTARIAMIYHKILKIVLIIGITSISLTRGPLLFYYEYIISHNLHFEKVFSSKNGKIFLIFLFFRISLLCFCFQSMIFFVLNVH